MTGAYLETSYRVCHDNFGLPKLSVCTEIFSPPVQFLLKILVRPLKKVVSDNARDLCMCMYKSSCFLAQSISKRVIRTCSMV